MKGSTSKKLFGILVLGFLMMVGLSSDALAQGRGRRASHLDKKCEKFVNCHDARDGRVDGRGPNRRSDTDLSSIIFGRNRRNRDIDDVRRRGRRDRDWDDDRRGRRRN